MIFRYDSLLKEYIIKTNMKSKIIFLTLFLTIAELCGEFPILPETTKNNTPQQAIINWVNKQRIKHKLSPLRQSILLQETASKYASRMVKLNIISHIDPEGNRAINRYRAMGGTALQIGEIIGAGGSVSQIERAWLASQLHKEVILDPRWTDIGVGYIRYGKNEILFDVLFSQNHIEGLQIIDRGKQILIRGAFDSKTRKKILKPIMINGLSRIKISSWEKTSGKFLFVIEKTQLDKNDIFIRLGYQNRAGNIIITNILESLHFLKKRNSQ